MLRIGGAITALLTPTVRSGLHRNSMLLQYDPPLTSINVRNVKKKEAVTRESNIYFACLYTEGIPLA